MYAKNLNVLWAKSLNGSMVRHPSNLFLLLLTFFDEQKFDKKSFFKRNIVSLSSVQLHYNFRLFKIQVSQHRTELLVVI